MKYHHYSTEEIDWLKSNAAGRGYQELTDMFNAHFNLQQGFWSVVGQLQNKGIRTGKSTRINGRTPLLTQNQADWLAANAAGRTLLELTEMFNRHFKLCLISSQIKHQIRTKKIYLGSYNLSKRASHTAVLTEKESVIIHRKSKYGYRYPFILSREPNEVKWQYKHHKVWEAANGPIPKGHVIIFGDGDYKNCNLDNLILVSKSGCGVLIRKKLKQNNADLTRIGVNIADVYLKIAERRKQSKHRRTE